MLRCELLVNESSNILHLIVDHDNRNDMGVNHSYAINFCSGYMVIYAKKSH